MNLREQMARAILRVKNPAHRVNLACGVNFGMDEHWPRKKGVLQRARLRAISRKSRRRNLRGRA